MAASESSLATELRECTICKEDMLNRTPKLLECKHSFCLPCLTGLAVAHRKSGLKVQCPKCKHNTRVKSGDLSDLQGNFLLGELQAAMDEHLRCPYCFYCNKLGKGSKAVSQCMNCRRYLCKECMDKHKKNPQFANHDIVAFLDDKQDLCSKHNEVALYICRVCKPARLICDVCMTVEDPCHAPEEFIDYTLALSDFESKLRVQLMRPNNAGDMLSKIEYEKEMLIKQVSDNAAAFIKRIEETKTEIVSIIEESFDTEPLRLASEAVQDSRLRGQMLLEKKDKGINEMEEAVTHINNILKVLSAEEEKARTFDPSKIAYHKDEEATTSVCGAYMKWKLLDLSTYPDDKEKAAQSLTTSKEPRSVEQIKPERSSVDKPTAIQTDITGTEICKKTENITTTIKQQLRTPVPLSAKDLDTPFDIGSMVEVNVAQYKQYGVIRWIGYYDSPNKPVAGIEMEEMNPAGTNGTYMNVRLFTCPPKRAMFMYLVKCRRDSRFQEEAD